MLIILRESYVRPSEFCCNEHLLVYEFYFCICKFSHPQKPSSSNFKCSINVEILIRLGLVLCNLSKNIFDDW